MTKYKDSEGLDLQERLRKMRHKPPTPTSTVVKDSSENADSVDSYADAWEATVSDEPLTPLGEEMERDAMIDTIAELERERDELRQLARMSLQQFEFQYGKRKRGWDVAFLMERLRAATQDTESSEASHNPERSLDSPASQTDSDNNARTWLIEANKVAGMFPDFGWPDRMSFSEAVAEQLTHMTRLDGGGES